MTLNIEIPDALEAVLEAKARAQGISTSGYASQLLERELQNPARKPKKSGLGLLAQYGPGPSVEEIDENRADMFRRFGEGPR
jgi:hypothetical protein